MNIDALKKQATRLAAYLGANHRVNLKHASALEALAAVHGARNWQTLAAQAATDSATQMEPPAGNKARAREPLRPLTWTTQNEPVLVPQNQWSRHAIAYGDSEEVNAWTGQHLMHCLQHEQGGLFLDMQWGQGAPVLRPVMDGNGLFIDLRAGEGPKHAPSVGQGRAVRVNLLAGLTPEGVRQVVAVFLAEAGVAPEQGRRLGGAAEAIAEGLLATGKAVTAGALLDHAKSAAKLASLRDATQGDAHEHLAGLLLAGDKMPGGLATLLAPLVTGLEAMLAAPSGKYLFCGEGPALSVLDLLSQQHAVAVRFPDSFAARAVWYQVWVAAMEDFARQRFSATSSMLNTPMALVVPDLHAADAARLRSLLEQGRRVNMALILGCPATARHSGAIAAAEQQAFNRVYLGEQKKRAEEEVLRRLAEAASVVLTPHSVQF